LRKKTREDYTYAEEAELEEELAKFENRDLNKSFKIENKNKIVVKVTEYKVIELIKSQSQLLNMGSMNDLMSEEIKNDFFPMEAMDRMDMEFRP